MDTLTRRRPGDSLRRRATSRSAEKPQDLIASAGIVVPSRMLRLNNYEWQRELWSYFRSLDAFRYAMLWYSQTMSKVRISAAVARRGGDEPEPVTDGPAAEAVAEFFGGSVGQAQYMRQMAIQMSVPGEGYVFATPDADDPNGLCWHVKSNTEVQVTSQRVLQPNGTGQTMNLWQFEVEEGQWMTQPPETLCFKQWYPDAEKSWRPDSPARAALNDMRILTMLNNRVIAMSVSRLASNGILLYPQEVTFPAKPQFAQELDPFTAEWLDIAAKVIENPGSALAAIPMPLKVPSQYIESFKHMDFSNTYDERLAALIDLYYDKLSIGMNMPKEVITGLGETSHWNSWQLDEQGVTVHIAPGAELILAGATKGYLHPWLKAAGAPIRDANGDEYIMWPDTSELVVAPDRTTAADQAHDRGAISDLAYRREKGFGESDKPTKEELKTIVLTQLALKDPTNAPAAFEELFGTPLAGASTGPGDGVPPATPPASGPGNQPSPQAPPEQNPSTPRAAPANQPGQ